MTGCNLYVSIDLTVAGVNLGGTGLVSLAIPGEREPARPRAVPADLRARRPGDRLRRARYERRQAVLGL
jgi:hypothetical protein